MKEEKDAKCYYCKKGFEGATKKTYVVKKGKVVRVHDTCQHEFEHGNELNIRIKVMPGRGEPSYGSKFGGKE
jgi:hypothetical protein